MTDQTPGCVFCPDPDLLREPHQARYAWRHVHHVERVHQLGTTLFAVFEPLNPVTPGHLLVVPAPHVEDATRAPHLAGDAVNLASAYAGRHRAANIITSIGADATQTVRHLHVHMVPRRAGDGLALPWTNQPRHPKDSL